LAEKDRITWNLLVWRESVVADAESHGGVGADTLSAGVQIDDVDARLHDLEAAELALQTLKAEDRDPNFAAGIHFVRGRLAAEAGDAPRAAQELEAFGAAYADPSVKENFAGYNCWIAPAEESAGRPDKADATLLAGGKYVDCCRFRGDILDGRGDWPGAQKAYADAVALAPDLPAGYYSWGVALAKHGDLNGAAAKLKAANQKGPHWADPLKAWGDVLVRQSHTKDALAKYDEALRYAPNWKQIKEVREALAKQKS
jgi:tetratricopeptide (TPR) repeat protein